jgi:hypothetical protein
MKPAAAITSSPWCPGLWVRTFLAGDGRKHGQRIRSPAAGLAEPFRSEIAGDHVRAARLWDDLGLGYSAALATPGSGDEAAMRNALARLSALGATAAARLARQKMRELGIASIPAGSRATTREHPAGLTRREQEVLELMSPGTGAARRA